MMCRLKRRFQIADMTLCQRSRTNILKPVKLLEIQISSSFILTEGVQIRPIVCISCVNFNNIFMTLKLRFKFKYFLKSVLQLLTQTPHSGIDGVPSYLAQ